VAPGWYSVRLNKCSGTGDDSLLAMQQMVDLERPTSVVLRDGPAAKFEWPRDQALVALNVGEYSEGLHNGNDACVHYPVETRTNVGGPAYQAADRKNCTSGIQKRDSSFCDCISDDSDLQTFCTAVATENLDGCEGINASGLRERCRRVTVHRAHDTSGCRAEG
jgi:hypothetical protein